MELIVLLARLIIRFFTWVGDNSSTSRPGESVAQSIARRLPPDQVPPELRDLIASDLARQPGQLPPRLADQVAMRVPTSVRNQLARERATILKKRQSMQANQSAEDVRLAARRAAQTRDQSSLRNRGMPDRPAYAGRPAPSVVPIQFVAPRQPQAPARRPAPPARKAAPVRAAGVAAPAPPRPTPISQAGSTASIEDSAAQILARGLVSRTAYVTSVNADSILVRLQQRDSLRAQILISELLAPPMALRG